MIGEDRRGQESTLGNGKENTNLQGREIRGELEKDAERRATKGGGGKKKRNRTLPMKKTLLTGKMRTRNQVSTYKGGY